MVDTSFYKIPLGLLRAKENHSGSYYGLIEIEELSKLSEVVSIIQENPNENPLIGKMLLSDIIKRLSSFDFEEMSLEEKAVYMNKLVYDKKYYKDIEAIRMRVREIRSITKTLVDVGSFCKIKRNWFNLHARGELLRRKNQELDHFTFRILLGVYGALDSSSDSVRLITRKEILARGYGFNSFKELEEDELQFTKLFPTSRHIDLMSQQQERKRLVNNKLKLTSRAIDFLELNNFFGCLELDKRELWFSRSPDHKRLVIKVSRIKKEEERRKERKKKGGDSVLKRLNAVDL